jgi:hypothetical protein
VGGRDAPPPAAWVILATLALMLVRRGTPAAEQSRIDRETQRKGVRSRASGEMVQNGRNRL